MIIQEMSKEECVQVLARARLARLGCAQNNQPYVVPVNIAYDEVSECLYGITTPGQKTDWMRANSLVCVEVEEVAAYDQWVSVIAFGRYEELPDTEGSENARFRAPERPRLVNESTPPWSADSCRHQYEDKGRDNERERAWRVLKTNPMWSEPCFAAWAARASKNSSEPFTSVYYRIRIERVTGHKATRDTRDVISNAAPAGRWDWLRKTVARVFTGRSRKTGSAF